MNFRRILPEIHVSPVCPRVPPGPRSVPPTGYTLHIACMHSAHDIPATRPHRARRPGWKIVWFRLAAFFAVMGPGFITANVDNDPGGILTYSQAGAKFGYSLLWTLIPTTVALIVVQEMAARMGAVTGKGLSDLIREEFGLRITFFTMVVLGLANMTNVTVSYTHLRAH